MRTFFSLILSLVLLASCGEAPKTEVSPVKKVRGEEPIRLDYTDIGICSEMTLANALKDMTSTDFDIKYWECDRSSNEGPFVALDSLEVEVRKTCGCNPEEFVLSKTGDGERSGNLKLSKGSWIVGFKVEFDGKAQTKQITLKVE